MNKTEPLLTLEPDEAHLWFAFPEKITEPETLAAYEKLLNEKEREQWQKFRFEKHRHQYLITRALVRSTLSRYSGRPPESWHFIAGNHGRPEIAPEEPPLKLRFNVSHTEKLVAFALTLGHDIGVDVEEIHRKTNCLELAQRYFSNTEADDLSQLPESKQKTRFFEYWTLKEALTKADGRGLSLSLDHFTFHLTPNAPIQVTFAPEETKAPGHWQFWQFQPTPNHAAAVALKKKDATPFRVIAREAVPLCEERVFVTSGV